MFIKVAVILSLMVPSIAVAAETADQLPEGGSIKTILTMLLGLAVVVALIFGFAWLVRRVNGVQGVNNGAMRVLSVLAVGQRERIMLLEVGGRQILVGVTAHNIQLLHVFDEPVVQGASRGEGDFAAKLQSMLQKGFRATDKGGRDRGDADS